MASGADISITSDIVSSIATPAGTLEVTNAFLGSLVVCGLIILMSFTWKFRASLIPGRFQAAGEMLVEYLDDVLQQQFIKKKLARRVLPAMVTLFLFIFISNQFSIIPMLQSMVIEAQDGGTSLFRTPTADLSLPFVMALMVVVCSQIIAFSISPLRHIGNYIKIVPLITSKSFGDFGMNLIEFFLGLLDIVSEFAKVISLAARLFGNVLAGELMILIIAGLASFTTYIVPIPFYVLSIFSGVIQTLVFVFLAIGFMATTVNAVSPEEEPA